MMRQIRAKRSAGGFTVIELLIVIMLIGILVMIAIPQYKSSRIRAQEAVLKEDLFVFRDVIDQYKTDKGVYPQTLDDIVSEGYIRAIPKDPITESADTWEVVYEDVGELEMEISPGIWDVKSGSNELSLDGTSRYNEW